MLVGFNLYSMVGLGIGASLGVENIEWGVEIPVCLQLHSHHLLFLCYHSKWQDANLWQSVEGSSLSASYGVHLRNILQLCVVEQLYILIVVEVVIGIILHHHLCHSHSFTILYHIDAHLRWCLRYCRTTRYPAVCSHHQCKVSLAHRCAIFNLHKEALHRFNDIVILAVVCSLRYVMRIQHSIIQRPHLALKTWISVQESIHTKRSSIRVAHYVI